LEFFRNQTLIIQGNKRVAGSNVRAAYAYFGQHPPPGHLVTLLSEVRGQELYPYIGREPGGQVLSVDGEPLRAAYGKNIMNTKFRLCNGAPAGSTPPPPPAAPPPAPPRAKPPMGPSELLRDSTFRSACFAALGQHAKEDCLSRLDGPSPPPRKIRGGGAEY